MSICRIMASVSGREAARRRSGPACGVRALHAVADVCPRIDTTVARVRANRRRRGDYGLAATGQLSAARVAGAVRSQLAPALIGEDPHDRSRLLMQAMTQTVKLDIAELERAYAGATQ